MNTSLHSTEALLSQVSWLRGLALELVQDHGEAEDLAQEAILRALERPPREPSAMRGFLRRVSQNIWLDRVRSESRRRDREEFTAREETVPATDDLADRLSAHRQLVEAVDRLDEPYRTTILLRYFDNLPPREIAERQRAPVKTVNTRIQRALERLRADLDRAHGNRRQWALMLAALVERDSARIAPTSAPVKLLAVAAGALAVVAVGVFAWRTSTVEKSRAPAESFAAAASESDSIASGLEDPRGTPPREALPTASPARNASKLAGRVVDAEGVAIPGASVSALFRPAAGFDERAGEFSKTVVGIADAVATEDGRFEIAVPDGSSYRLEARAPGFGTEIQDDALAGGDVVFELKRAGRFEFTVLHDPGDTPCAHAGLTLSRTGVVGSIFEGETSADGRLAIPELAPGVYLVAVTPQDAERAFTTDLVLRDGERTEHVIRAGAGSVVQGSVRSSVDGAPIAGARVTNRPDRIATTDAAGVFELRGLRSSPARVSFEVEAEGFAPASFVRDPKSEDRAELTLVPEARVSGRFVDTNGNPAARAWVIVDGRETRTQADGSFVVRGLTPKRTPIVFARAVGHATLAALSPKELIEGDNDIGTVTLEQAASVAGRVLAVDGRPLAGATVMLKPRSALTAIRAQTALQLDALLDDETTGMVDDQTTAVVGVGSVGNEQRSILREGAPALDAGPFRDRTVRTNSAGNFRVFDLPAGQYQITARARGHALTPPLALELAAGEDRGGIELAVAGGSAITGHVRGTDDTPIAGAWIVLIEPNGRRLGINSLSALDGSFELHGADAGPYELEVTFHGLVAGRSYSQERLRDVGAPVRGLDVRLAPLAFIEGVLVDEADRPIADVYVRATDTESRRTSMATDERGRFKLGVVEGRTAKLDVQGPVGRAIRGNSKVDPVWKGELDGVVAGTVGVVLKASREE
jgi:RNA polymerase sigma-70 factor (ECF subfamily)